MYLLVNSNNNTNNYDDENMGYSIGKSLCYQVIFDPCYFWSFRDGIFISGLTIADERPRLDPIHTNELVFLHEAKSDLKKYGDSHSFNR